jgi:hypothetical protein
MISFWDIIKGIGFSIAMSPLAMILGLALGKLFIYIRG